MLESCAIGGEDAHLGEREHTGWEGVGDRTTGRRQHGSTDGEREGVQIKNEDKSMPRGFQGYKEPLWDKRMFTRVEVSHAIFIQRT